MNGEIIKEAGLIRKAIQKFAHNLDGKLSSCIEEPIPVIKVAQADLLKASEEMSKHNLVTDSLEISKGNLKPDGKTIHYYDALKLRPQATDSLGTGIYVTESINNDVNRFLNIR